MFGIRKVATTAGVTAKIAELQQRRDAAATKLAELKTRHADALLDDDAKAVEKLEAEMRATVFEIERITGVMPTLQSRLIEMQRTERRAELERQHAVLARDADAVATDFRGQYLVLAQQLMALLRREQDIQHRLSQWGLIEQDALRDGVLDAPLAQLDTPFNIVSPPGPRDLAGRVLHPRVVLPALSPRGDVMWPANPLTAAAQQVTPLRRLA